MTLKQSKKPLRGVQLEETVNQKSTRQHSVRELAVDLKLQQSTDPVVAPESDRNTVKHSLLQ